MQKCTLALGCFWKPEETFKSKAGIIETEVGYAGGLNERVTYEEVCNGNTGHAEVVRLTFDENIISFKKIISNQIRHLENVRIDLNSLKSKKPEDICIHLSNRKIIPTFSQELYKLLQQQYEFNEDEKVNQFQAYIKKNNKVYFS